MFFIPPIKSPATMLRMFLADDADFVARKSSKKSINNHCPSMQHSTPFRHMLSLRYIICCFTLLMLYSGTPNLVLNGERKKGFCAFN
jgi:hypothetical protein